MAISSTDSGSIDSVQIWGEPPNYRSILRITSLFHTSYLRVFSISSYLSWNLLQKTILGKVAWSRRAVEVSSVVDTVDFWYCCITLNTSLYPRLIYLPCRQPECTHDGSKDGDDPEQPGEEHQEGQGWPTWQRAQYLVSGANRGDWCSNRTQETPSWCNLVQTIISAQCLISHNSPSLCLHDTLSPQKSLHCG